MKKFKCYDCDLQFHAETREELLGMLYDHYLKDHHEIITGADKAEKKRWMEQFEKDWSTAEEA